MTPAASAQKRTFYDAKGNAIHYSTVDSQGTVTHHDAKGNVIGRESRNGSTTSVHFHDGRGRKIGTITVTKR
jgi:YD repeat-containing protein